MNSKKDQGDVAINRDFNRLNLHTRICDALKRALLANFGHTALDTQKRVFHHHFVPRRYARRRTGEARYTQQIKAEGAVLD